MASYMHIGDSNNIDRKIKSILLIGGGGNTYTARNIYYGNSEGKAEPSYRRVNTSTWYTSGEQSDGMYDTTALTSEATTNTEYETSEVINNNYRGTVLKTLITDNQVAQNNYYTYNVSSYETNSFLYMTSFSTRTYNASFGEIKVSASYFSGLKSNTSVYSYTRSTKNSNQSASNSISLTTVNAFYVIYGNTTMQYIGVDKKQFYTYTCITVNNEILGTYSYISSMTNGYNRLTHIHKFTVNTNTKYTITTATNYLTCETTYGYTGKSSSTYIPD